MAKPQSSHPHRQPTSSPHPRPPRADDAHLDRVVEPEYASVSGAAIFAVVLSAISVVAFLPVSADLPLPWTWLRLPLLLTVPLAAVGVALAARRSIRRSEGTRTGLRVAQIALVLALVITVGAGTMHGIRQVRRHQLLVSLIEKADGYLQSVLNDQPEAIFSDLVVNGARSPKDRPGYVDSWRMAQREFHGGSGEYYGRKLQQAVPIMRAAGAKGGPDENQEEVEQDTGLVTHRLLFANQAIDMQFLFVLVEGQWKLVSFGFAPVSEWPKAGQQPKKRFDP
jgi:hypothetical protein